MFSGLSIMTILRGMPISARAIFNRMFVPTVIVGMWAYAHFDGITARTLKTTWRDANNVEHCGNPYTMSVPRNAWLPSQLSQSYFEDDNDGEGGPDNDPYAPKPAPATAFPPAVVYSDR